MGIKVLSHASGRVRGTTAATTGTNEVIMHHPDRNIGARRVPVQWVTRRVTVVSCCQARGCGRILQSMSLELVCYFA